MSRVSALLCAAAGLATLSACATPIAPVDVTRFHRLDTPAVAAQGSYAIASGDADAQPRLADRDYYAAVARQLDRLGYRPASAGSAQPDYLVSVIVERAERPDGANGSGVNVGVGGGTGGYRSGVGVGVGLDLTRLLGGRRDVVATRMSVRMNRRGETLALWEGRAETTARSGTPAAQAGLTADKLATALFADFPGRSGETISVK